MMLGGIGISSLYKSEMGSLLPLRRVVGEFLPPRRACTMMKLVPLRLIPWYRPFSSLAPHTHN